MSFWLWMAAGLGFGVVWSWRVIAAALGRRTIPDLTEPRWDVHPAAAPSLTVVVPARNEQEKIRECLESLLASDHPNLEIIAVDDRSEDNTGAIMDELAAQDPSQRIRVLHIEQLPSGWLGKPHAMWKAAKDARGEFVLFTDGDIRFRHDTLLKAMAYVEAKKVDHLVVFPTMELKSWGERMMAAFSPVLFIFGMRFWKVADPRARDYIGTGAFNLVRRSAYESIGTFEALRMNVIDDLNLGRLIKAGGFASHFVFGRGLVSLRWATSLDGITANLQKNLFALMRFNVALAIAGIFALLFVFLGPLIGVILAPGWAKVGFAVALVSIASVYFDWRGVSGVSPIYLALQPVAVLVCVYAVMRSVYATIVNGGVIWRGTLYRLEELRKNL